MNYSSDYNSKLVDMKTAASMIKNGDKMMCSMNGTPYTLMNEIGKRSKELSGVRFFSNLIYKPINFFSLESIGHIDVTSYFRGPSERIAEKEGLKTDTYVYQLFQFEDMVRESMKPTVGVFHVTPFDDEGYASFGPNPVGGNVVSEVADKIIVQLNDKNPRMRSDFSDNNYNRIHISKIDAIVEVSEQMPIFTSSEPDDVDKKVASFIAERIQNGSTIQVGIGGIANAVAYSLENHKNLGVHTEMFTESMVHLMKKGVINNSEKTIYRGASIAGFAQGLQDMYDFMDNNKEVQTLPISYINDPYTIAKNKKMVSINAIMGVDLLGQISSESIGFSQFSGLGGQLDYVRGAQMSDGGASILAMHSTTKKKDGSLLSKICLSHPQGTAISVARSDVQYVCTEYGMVDLKYKTIDQRARLLISIAHPDFRDELMYQAKNAGIII
ncbi:MAG: 4-hydroxybutyrate--acetyl-CoA CoA transferase [Eubacteriaceae bacterium]|nr:4-hydroxybutyrate--acetyl-CoA CoA transferase [Eubacteriaceae bacterium]